MSRLLKTSIFPRKHIWDGWRFLPLKLIIPGVVIGAGVELVIFPHRCPVSLQCLFLATILASQLRWSEIYPFCAHCCHVALNRQSRQGNQRVSVGWRFCPGKLTICGVVIQVGQKLGICTPPLMRLLKTSIFHRKPTGVGYRFRPSEFIHFGVVIEAVRNLALFRMG